MLLIIPRTAGEMSDTDRAKMNWMLPPDEHNWQWEDETPLEFAHRMVEAAEEVEELRAQITDMAVELRGREGW